MAAAMMGEIDICQVAGLNQKINSLKTEQSELLAKKKKVSKEIRNSEKKRRRLKNKAKQLTDDDLLAVLRLRKEKAGAAAVAAATEHAAAEDGLLTPTPKPEATDDSSPVKVPATAGVTLQKKQDCEGISKKTSEDCDEDVVDDDI